MDKAQSRLPDHRPLLQVEEEKSGFIGLLAVSDSLTSLAHFTQSEPSRPLESPASSKSLSASLRPVIYFQIDLLENLIPNLTFCGLQEDGALAPLSAR